jgi:Ca2+-binding RTX toxin-like protein
MIPMRLSPLLLPLAAAAALAGPAAARAADVKVVTNGIPPTCSKCGDGGSISTIYYTAAPGEANDVAVAAEPGGVVFRETGAALTPGDGCTAPGDGTVHCGTVSAAIRVVLGDGDDRMDTTQSNRVTSVEGGAGADTFTGSAAQDGFTGGDGDDRFDGRGGPDSASGGPGNDVISAGDGKDNLFGGPGDDVVRGGGADDFINGGGGIDQLFGDGADDQIDDGDTTGAANADVIDGGAGTRDIVRYGRKAAIVVDLSAPGSPAGEAGEGDALAGIEGVYSGSGIDRLTGDDGPNAFASGSEADVIDGRGGDDTISSGTLPAICGPGKDVVSVRGMEPIRADCERVIGGGPAIDRPVVTKKTVTVRFRCVNGEFELRFRSGCTISSVALGAKGALGKAGPASAKSGRTATLVVRLTAAGRAAVKAHGPMAFRIVIRDGGPRGGVDSTLRFALAI